MSYVTIDKAVQIASQHYTLRQYGAAEDICRHVLAVNPRHPEALNLASLLALVRRDDGAAEDYARRAIAARPDFIEAVNNLGIILSTQARHAEAIVCYRQVLVHMPDSAATLNNIGTALANVGEFDEAEVCCKRAIELAPKIAETYVALGHTYHRMGRHQEAMRQYERALAIDPHNPRALANRAVTYLLMGRYEEGWRDHDLMPGLPQVSKKFVSDSSPAWRGEPLGGKRLLIHTDQGLGDTLMFCRYLPLVQDYGGHVIFQCQPETHSLLHQFAGVTLVSTDEPLPEHDLQCWLMSLPHYFGTTLKTLPVAVNYLRVDPKKAADWRERLPKNDQLKIGVVWAGNPRHTNDANRSIPFAIFRELLNVEGVTFVNLQKGKGAEQARDMPGENWVDPAAELKDFADTAAIVSNLDLVITVDTAVAHLAGAIGQKTWVLLPYVPDFRWLLDRDESPWYPSIKLFRQEKVAQWPNVIQNVISELIRLRNKRRP